MGASTHSKSRHGTMNSSGGSKVVQFKLVLLGDSAVGKSSLVLRFVRGQFFEYQESTIGAAFLTQTVALNDTTVKFEIWDTAGQEKYHSLAPMYYRDAQVAVLIYDVTKKESYESLKRWVEELKENGPPNLMLAVVGNKIDLDPVVDTEAASSYAKSLGALVKLTSAKVDKGISELFDDLSEEIYKREVAADEERERLKL